MSVLRELTWRDIPRLADLETQLFADDAWSEATWWSELAARPRRAYRVLEGELGIEVSPAWWRRGAASEVMRSLVPWARETLRIRTFTAETMPGNRAATRLAEKVGLVPTGQTGKRRWSL